MGALGTITDERDGKASEICRVFRVAEGQARLFLGRDRKIWLGYGETPERFSYVADLPAAEHVSKKSVCRAANMEGTKTRPRPHYRLVGAALKLPEHFMELADRCHPTITGSIRCGEVRGDVKKDYAYLEVQRIVGDEYEVVDSWSHASTY